MALVPNTRRTIGGPNVYSIMSVLPNLKKVEAIPFQFCVFFTASLPPHCEPLQAASTIVEDGCFIGARSEVAEGVVVGEGSVLSMGVFLTATTRIVDRKTGEVHRGRVPPYSVVVPGALPDPHGGGPSLSCAVIVKTVDAQTRSKTSINELLRD